MVMRNARVYIVKSEGSHAVTMHMRYPNTHESYSTIPSNFQENRNEKGKSGYLMYMGGETHRLPMRYPNTHESYSTFYPPDHPKN